VWIDEQRFRGFACSECSWRFDSSPARTGKSFEDMMRNFESQRDKEFASHVCADYPRTAGRDRNSQSNSPSLERTKLIRMTPDKEATATDWRELARRIQKEEDPEKVFELVQQLIDKFNEERRRMGLPATRKVENPQD
jgi:hypothetical protein